MSDRCARCGMSEASHHFFEESFDMPEGCACDPQYDGAQPICEEYIVFKGERKDRCSRCKHVTKCHQHR